MTDSATKTTTGSAITPPSTTEANVTAKTTTTSEDAAVQQAKYKATCDKYVANGLTSNRSIQFLIQQLDKMGCTPPDGFIRCTDCGYLKALGAFHLLSETKVADASSAANTLQKQQLLDNNKPSTAPACSSYFTETLKKIGLTAKSNQAAQDALLEQMNQTNNNPSGMETTKRPEIFLCQQHLSSQDQAHRTIVHELIHAVDTCRSKMDPQKNCIHLACTEIRAENLSQECNFMNELLRVGPHSLQKHGQDCVKRRAMLSVSSHPRCRDRAEEYVDAAMGRCYRDIFPFERHPNEN